MAWACRVSRPAVRYATCAQLVNELVEAATTASCPGVGRYGRLTCCASMIGYVKIDPAAPSSSSNHHRTRRTRVDAIATNLPFSEWGTVFRILAGHAIVDRVTSTPTSWKPHPVLPPTHQQNTRAANASADKPTLLSCQHGGELVFCHKGKAGGRSMSWLSPRQGE